MQKRRAVISLRGYLLCESMVKSVEWCQCCQRRVALVDAKGSSNSLGNEDAAQIIHASDNASSFHISALLVNSRITMLVSVNGWREYRQLNSSAYFSLN